MGKAADKAASVTQEPASLLYDAPLADPKNDSLGRAPFAQRLGDAILRMNADEGFVFALNSPWGSGKTTVVNFALRHIKEASNKGSPLSVNAIQRPMQGAQRTVEVWPW